MVNKVKAFTIYFWLTVFLIVVLFPFIWMIITSLKPIGTGLTLTIVPRPPTLSNYKSVLTQYKFGRYFINSLTVASIGALGATILCTMAAFAFAKLQFPFKRPLFVMFLSVLMVPGLMFVVPQFAIVYRLGWINTYKAMIIPHLANVFGMFLLVQYMKTIPDELVDAARVDGANNWTIFLKLIVPLSGAMIATVFLLTFQFHWNNFLWQLIVATDENMYTVPVGLAMFRSAHEELHTLKMAASAISILPITMIFIFAQRYFIEGILRGAIKG